MRQALIRIQGPGNQKTFPPEIFRERIAKAADGDPRFTPEFFGRGSHRAPDIRIIGNGHWVGVLSEGGHAEALAPAIDLVTQVASAYWERPLQAVLQQPEFGVSDGVATYVIPDLVIKQARVELWHGAPVDLVKTVILNGLDRIAMAYGIDLPTARDLMPVIHAIDSTVKPLRVSGAGTTAVKVVQMRVEISLAAELHGIWQVGSLQSRGHGRLNRVAENG